MVFELLATAFVFGSPEPPPEADWTTTVSAATDVPLQVGAAVRVEMPQRVRFAASAGVLPEPYVDLINTAAVEAGAYDEDTAKLVKASLKRSLVLRAAAGWRPFVRRGFYAEANYTWVSLGGDIAGEDFVALATGVDPPGGVAAQRKYDVNSTLHLLGAELGWEWTLTSRPVRLRAGLGFASTIAAETTMEPRFDPVVPALVDRFTSESEEYLDGIYLDYVHVPVVSLSAGWVF